MIAPDGTGSTLCYHALQWHSRMSDFIAHVDSTLLHDLHWPILGLLARHYVEHLEQSQEPAREELLGGNTLRY